MPPKANLASPEEFWAKISAQNSSTKNPSPSVIKTSSDAETPLPVSPEPQTSPPHISPKIKDETAASESSSEQDEYQDEDMNSIPSRPTTPVVNIPRLSLVNVSHTIVARADLDQVLTGLARVFAREKDLDKDMGTLNVNSLLHKPSPLKFDDIPESDIPNIWPIQMIKDVASNEEWDFEPWFSSFPSNPLTILDPAPAYGVKQTLGLVPKPREETEEEKKKKEPNPHESPTFICIVLAESYPLLPYSEETFMALGDTYPNRFATALRIQNFPYDVPRLIITINIAYGSHNVEVLSISIPLQDLCQSPKTTKLSPDELKQMWDLPKKCILTHGAFMTTLGIKTREVRFQYRKRAISDLLELEMSHLRAVLDRIEDFFKPDKLALTLMVTSNWEDFELWSTLLSTIPISCYTDPLMSLKTHAGGQPITMRNMVKVSSDTPMVPARMEFQTVDQAITILGDAAAREHAYEKHSAESLAGITCYVAMMPVGPQKCKITNHQGQIVDVPYLYSFSVIKTTDDNRFAYVVPPLNSTCKLQIQLPYRSIDPPQAHLSEQERVEIISKKMHKELWSHHLTRRVSKAEREQAWVDDYTTIIKQYLDPAAFAREGYDANQVTDEQTNEEDLRRRRIVHYLANKLSLELQKVRANEEQEIKSETPKEHHTRVASAVNAYRNHMRIPVDADAGCPQTTVVRMAHGEPMNELSDHQFIGYRPRYPGWPKAGPGVPRAPFLDFKEPRLPAITVEESIPLYKDQHKNHRYLIPAKFSEVYDDITAKSKVQGLLRMKEHQRVPITEWFATFKKEPITTDITHIFSILRQVMHKFFYDPNLPFQEEKDIPLEIIDTLQDDKGEDIEWTTPEAQRRAAVVANFLLNNVRLMSEAQLRGMKKLLTSEFGALFIEGVPGSGKTWLAIQIVLGCIYSHVDEKLLTSQMPEPLPPKDEDSDDDESVTSEDYREDQLYNMRPAVGQPLERVEKKKDENEQSTRKNAPPPECYDFPSLAFGPTVDQLEEIQDALAAWEPTIQGESPIDTKAQKIVYLFTIIHDVYCYNFDKVKPSDIPHEAAIAARDAHWRKWLATAESAMTHRGEAVKFSNDEDKTDNVKAATTKEIEAELENKDGNSISIISPKVMIIANHNANGDDAARLMDNLLNTTLGFDELIVRVTNLQLAAKALKRKFKPEEAQACHDAPGMAEFMLAGLDKDRLDDFASRKGEFSPIKFGGIWRLEDIMLRMLQEGHRPALFRQLQRLGNPADVFSKEESESMKKTLDEFIKEILKKTKVVVCTFVIAQTLMHKEFYQPTVVMVDEASREQELYAQWTMLGIGAQLVIFVGDCKQDEPFVSGRYLAKDDPDRNIHLKQLLTPLTRRVLTMRPSSVIFLAENHRQHGTLQEISSDLFYDGEMTSVHNPDNPTRVLGTWYLWIKDLLTEYRGKIRKNKDLDEQNVAELLYGTRLTIKVDSSMTKKGFSPENKNQARLAVELAARAHQSHIPGPDEIHRPTICIIAPYTAQVDLIKTYLRKLSDKEICHALVEVRTQAGATGGEWDGTINTFVRDTNMGYLAETNRLNVMWTRPKLWSIDIFDVTFYERPRGPGSFVIKHYARHQARNGAVVYDITKWNEGICDRCHRAHPIPCEATLKCFHCSGPHHVRDCNDEGKLTPDINPDHMNLATQADLDGHMTTLSTKMMTTPTFWSTRRT
jgi:hypothetical protein